MKSNKQTNTISNVRIPEMLKEFHYVTNIATVLNYFLVNWSVITDISIPLATVVRVYCGALYIVSGVSRSF